MVVFLIKISYIFKRDYFRKIIDEEMKRFRNIQNILERTFNFDDI